ncbi:MAG TPA: NADH-quinone oxidoreductase subunit M [Aggregatilinea sp.]|jgi:NADH-quinone oxidoreductase subunit M|uniref:complex I subunit 4 family protein n=1 Tax=Aggregatilinea sp. TaxID=2806333 RepID=UPI002CABD729|nr:NADH-quinone oxidoreductase subunit M [Aggregatilinea sp.]HML24334.1 NADH-quinone oxidoreductase subunit M [Aggregatilinea sp.]
MQDFLSDNFLAVLTLLPLLGAVLVFVLPRGYERWARWLTLGLSLVMAALTIYIFIDVQNNPLAKGEWAFESQAEWFPLLNSTWHVGVDGLSAAMILLTGLLVPLAVLISFEVEENVQAHMALYLFLEAGMLGVFVALDLIVFFLFWEIGLVPMYFLIFLWGGENRRYAANKFFLYTMGGSLGLLLAIQGVGITLGSFDIPNAIAQWPATELATHKLWIFVWDGKYFALLGFAIAFMIKMPVWPFHTWLPDAHTEAPTGGSMLLAGVLLKLGAYGFLRLAIPLFPEEWIVQRSLFNVLDYNLVDVIGLLAVIGIIMGALAAWAQDDFKRLVAYSSVNHMGFVVLGLAIAAMMYGVSYAEQQRHFGLLGPALGIEQAEGQSWEQSVTAAYPAERFESDQANAVSAMNGAVLQMFMHGLTSAGMFLLVGALYHKAHTRDLRRFGGLWPIVPVFGAILIFVSMGNLGLPGFGGFVAEFLVVSGAFQMYPIYVFLAMFGLLVTGIFVLKGIQKVLHGPVNEEWVEYDRTEHKLEINVREVVAIVPLMVLMLVTGLYPNWIMPVINSGVSHFLGLLGG